MNNHKLDAKLQILIYAANHILGMTTKAEKALANYKRVADSVTNEWTIALINLITAIFPQDDILLEHQYGSLSNQENLSKIQQLIIKESNYYN